MNSKEFTQKILDIVKDKKPITHIDAIIHYCESNNIEVETTTRLISKSLKEKIKQSINANMLKIKRYITCMNGLEFLYHLLFVEVDKGL